MIKKLMARERQKDKGRVDAEKEKDKYKEKNKSKEKDKGKEKDKNRDKKRERGRVAAQRSLFCLRIYPSLMISSAFRILF